MRSFALCLSTLVASTALAATAAPAPLTREALLQGSDIPERREFPLNTDLSPCADFYQYACSKVNASFKLRDDRSTHTFSFSDSAEKLLTMKKNFMKYLLTHENLTGKSKVLHDNYVACMNEPASRDDEKSLVKQQIQSLESAHDREGLLELLSKRIDQADWSLIDLESAANQQDPSTRDLILDADLLSLPERSYYANKPLLKDYEDVVRQFFKSAGLDHAEDRARSVIEFESAYAQKYPLPLDFRKRFSENTIMDRAEFLRLYPALKLERILGRIPAKTQMRNLEPEAFAFLDAALQMAPVEQLRNVALYKSASRYMDDAFPEFFQKRFDFEKKYLGGPQTRPVREERCTRGVMASFGRELDSELLPILFPGFEGKKVVDLAEKIRASILTGLKQNKWLSKQGREGAIRKMKTATLLLVAPSREEDWDFTPAAEYDPSHRYANNRLLKKNLIEKTIRELGEPRNRTRWGMGPLTVNAYYTPSDNTFVLPIGILQYPFYDAQGPEQTNLAAIGSVIGHELGHGIDDKGALYDEKGRLHAWMTPEDVKNFEARGGKFVARFELLKHNGKLTLGENIGDHVGITASHRAAFGNPNASSAKNSDKKLEQAFFVQYARSWCQVMRPDYRALLLKTDPHAIGEARVNEQVRHLPSFQEAFACKPGDGMYLAPSDRIQVW